MCFLEGQGRGGKYMALDLKGCVLAGYLVDSGLPYLYRGTE